MQLSGGKLERFRPNQFRSAITGITANLTFSRLHCLLGTGWESAVGSQIGRFVLEYDDLQRRELPIVYGKHVLNWLPETPESNEVDQASVAWVGHNKGSRVLKSCVRIYHAFWDNPRPDIKVKSIDVISEMSPAAPFVLALTALDPSTADFWNASASAFEKTNAVGQALEACTKAIEASGAYTDFRCLPGTAYLNRARLYKKLGRLTEAAIDNLSGLGLPQRRSDTPSHLLDLSLYYNAPLTGGYWDGPSSLKSLPIGRQLLGGVEFDARGIIQLAGTEHRFQVPFPAEVRDIPVSRRFRRAHFLHATFGFGDDEQGVAKYLFRYRDGTIWTVPIIYGEHLRSWGYRDPREKLSGGTLAWKSTAGLRLFRSTVENPNPEMQVEHLDLVAEKNLTAPFIIAVTVEP